MPFLAPIVFSALAIALSALGAKFSIIGLVEYCPTVPTDMIALGALVEAVALCLVASMSRDRIGRGWRAGGIVFVGAIMAANAFGTYAHLTAAHISQAAILEGATDTLRGIEERLVRRREALDDARKESAALQGEYDAYVAAGKPSKAASERQADAGRNDEIRTRIEQESAAVEKIQAERDAARQTVVGQKVSEGPAASVAALLHIGAEGADEVFQGLIMFLLQPLALFLSGLGAHLRTMPQRRDGRAVPAEAVAPIVAPPAVIAEAVQVDLVDMTAPPADQAVTKPEQAALVDAGAGQGEIAEVQPVKKGGRPKGAKDKAPRKRKADPDPTQAAA